MMDLRNNEGAIPQATVPPGFAAVADTSLVNGET